MQTQDLGGPNAEDLILLALHERLHVDRTTGVTRADHRYLELFPSHAALVMAELAGLCPDLPATRQGRFGRFQIVREIGAGGQGKVFEARDGHTGRQVALKILRQAQGPEATARFRREIAIAAEIQDPAICAVHDFGETEGRPWVAMRLVEGTTLAIPIAAHRERKTRPASAEIDRYTALLAKVAHAVHRLHEHGVVHRDLKPGNLMITPEETPIVLDLGVAQAIRPDAWTLTRSGDVLGTTRYMAPEQLDRRSVVDPRADVFALGVVLYETLTARHPFEARTEPGVAHAILERRPQSPRRHNRAIGRSLARVVLAALEKDVADRYPSAREFAEQLGNARAGRAAHPSLLVHVSRRTRSWLLRSPLRIAALCAGVVLTAAVGVLVVERQRQHRDLAAVAEEALGRGLALAAAHSDQAADQLRSALRLRTRIYSEDAPPVVEAKLALADTLMDEQTWDEAAVLYGDVLSRPRAGAHPAWGVRAHLGLCRYRLVSGHLDLARSHLARGRTAAEEHREQPDSLRVVLHWAEGALRMEERNLDAAREHLRRGLLIAERVHLPDDSVPTGLRQALAECLLRTDRAEDAAEALELATRVVGARARRGQISNSWKDAVTLWGHALLRSGRAREALAEYRRATETRELLLRRLGFTAQQIKPESTLEIHVARSQLALGDREAALGTLLRVLDETRAPGGHAQAHGRGACFMLLAELLAARGDSSESENALVQAIAELRYTVTVKPLDYVDAIRARARGMASADERAQWLAGETTLLVTQLVRLPAYSARFGDVTMANGLLAVGCCARLGGSAPGADRCLRDALVRLTAWYGPRHEHTLRARGELAEMIR